MLYMKIANIESKGKNKFLKLFNKNKKSNKEKLQKLLKNQIFWHIKNQIEILKKHY